jgi:hypothetical protein
MHGISMKDFSVGVRGKYAKRYAQGTNVGVIDPDVAEYFPDHESVNEALRGLTEIIKRQKRPNKGMENNARKLVPLMPAVQLKNNYRPVHSFGSLEIIQAQPVV